MQADTSTQSESAWRLEGCIPGSASEGGQKYADRRLLQLAQRDVAIPRIGSLPTVRDDRVV